MRRLTPHQSGRNEERELLLRASTEQRMARDLEYNAAAEARREKQRRMIEEGKRSA